MLWQAWFDKWNLEGLSLLCQYPELDTTARINALGGDEQGVTRRAIIFKVSELLYNPDEVSEDETEAYFRAAST